MANPAQYNVRLLQLNCYHQNENDGDEVFIKYKNERIWPRETRYHQLSEGSHKINIDIAGVEKEAQISFELWDYDFLTPNDKLGTFSMLVNERGGPFTTDMKKNDGADDSRYSIEWEVV